MWTNVCQIQEDMITFLKKTEYTPRFCKIFVDPILMKLSMNLQRLKIILIRLGRQSLLVYKT